MGKKYTALMDEPFYRNPIEIVETDQNRYLSTRITEELSKGRVLEISEEELEGRVEE